MKMFTGSAMQHLHSGPPRGGCDKCEVWGTGSVINMLQTWQSDRNLIKVIIRERWKEREDNDSGEELEPTIWQMACHALTNCCSQAHIDAQSS